jgi:hypothetical protein
MNQWGKRTGRHGGPETAWVAQRAWIAQTAWITRTAWIAQREQA